MFRWAWAIIEEMALKHDIIQVAKSDRTSLKLESQIPGESIRMATPPPASNMKCHYCSCAVVSSNVSRIKCYAPGCDQLFHLYCSSQGVLIKHNLDHFDDNNAGYPYLKVVCKKGCYPPKALRHHSNMSIHSESQNIPWKDDGRDSCKDLNNSENIVITWF
jgi:hypothetical protein